MKTTIIKNGYSKSMNMDIKLVITIRIHDDCKNGHNDLAITADAYNKNGSWQAGGCLHDEIMELAPELEPFIEAHNRSDLGVPTYPLVNGLYFMYSKEQAANHLWIDIEEMDNFKNEWTEFFTKEKDIKNRYYCFNEFLKSKGIYEMWKTKMQKVIGQLEEMTGQKYVRPENQVDQIEKDLKYYSKL
jgi:hypothetical protein